MIRGHGVGGACDHYKTSGLSVPHIKGNSVVGPTCLRYARENSALIVNIISPTQVALTII